MSGHPETPEDHMAKVLEEIERRRKEEEDKAFLSTAVDFACKTAPYSPRPPTKGAFGKPRHKR